MPTWLRLRRLLLAAGLCAYPLLREQVLAATDPWAVPPPRDDRLRVVSWNLRNFPGDHDLARLREQLDQLAPQVLALQEVLDPAAVESLRPGFRWHASTLGGRHGQRLMIGWDPTVVEVLAPREHEALTIDGRVRPALSAYVRPTDGDGFHLVVVHLKATRSGLPIRREQWSLLAPLLRPSVLDPVDPDLLVLGDFNAAGGPDTTPEQEREQLAAALGAVGLRPWSSVGGCTAYWDGSRRDGWLEPSLLDLVWTRGFGSPPEAERQAWAGAHCGRHHCDPLHASEPHPDPDLHRVSDHCPVVIDLPRPQVAPA